MWKPLSVDKLVSMVATVHCEEPTGHPPSHRTYHAVHDVHSDWTWAKAFAVGLNAKAEPVETDG